MLSTDSFLQNRYRINQFIKPGSMGAVYQALDTRLNNRVAIKELRLEDSIGEADFELIHEAFAREAALLANLNHPSIPRAFDFFIENEAQYLVMEFVEGADLAEVLRRQRGQMLPVEQILDWVKQILSALIYLHEQQIPIIHRDLKPSNIKLMPDGKIKLIDFGIAKGLLGQMTPTRRESSLRMATLEYAPPEQAFKACNEWRMILSNISPEKVEEALESETDARTDIFALAATAYRLLTLKLPADSFTRALAMWNGKPDPLVPLAALRPDLSPEICDALMRSMSLSPAQRVPSAAELLEILFPVEEKNADEVPEIEALEQKVRELERRLKEEMNYRRSIETKWLSLEAQTARQQREFERQKKFAQDAEKQIAKSESGRRRAETENAQIKNVIASFARELQNAINQQPIEETELCLQLPELSDEFQLLSNFNENDCSDAYKITLENDYELVS